MEQAQEIKIVLRQGQWSHVAEKWLSQALGDAAIEDYHAQWKIGRATVVYVLCDGWTVGAALLRIDKSPSKAEGVIVAAAAEVRGVDMVADVLPGLEKMFIGVDSIRIHTDRPGLVKKLRGVGYTATSAVLKKRVSS